MLSEAQIKKLISANDSLQVQLADANEILAAREQEIEFLGNELAEATELRSKIDGQQGEIESIQNQLGEKQLAAKGAEERELELHQELTEMALLNKQYSELLQDYTYLQSQFKDIQVQFTVLQKRNFQLEQTASYILELEIKLENSLMERDNLKDRIKILEAQKMLKEI